MKWPRSSLLFIPLLFLATGAFANASPPASADFRCELTKFVSDLGNVHALGVSSAEGQQKIDSLSAGQLKVMEIGLSTLPRWQELPTVMASLDAADQEHTRQVISRILERSGPAAADPTQAKSDADFRADFLFLLDQLARFAPVMGGDFGARVARTKAHFEGLPASDWPRVREQYNKLAPNWQASILGQGKQSSATSESLVARLTNERLGYKPVAMGCGDCCDLCLDCWIEAVGCYIDEVAGYVAQIATFVSDFFTKTIPDLFNKIAALPQQALDFFTKVFNDVKNFVTNTFNTLINSLPTTINGALSFIGLDPNHIDWNTIAGKVPTITPPCPQQAVDIAAQVCDRGGDALTQLLFDLMPDDGLSFLFKAGVALVHYPLTYLCQCHDDQEAIALADAEAAHREWTGQHLDLKLSTRATQASVDVLSTELGVLDVDVAKLETKLDSSIDPTASRIDVNTKRIDATVNRIETKVNNTESTATRIETKIDSLTGGNTTQQTFLGDFTKLMKRVNIENNLLENKPNVISLFQLPSVFGGNLETVSTIVADTIKMNLNAKQNTFGAERELARADGLFTTGNFAKAYEAYRSAYSEAVK